MTDTEHKRCVVCHRQCRSAYRVWSVMTSRQWRVCDGCFDDTPLVRLLTSCYRQWHRLASEVIP